MRVPNAPVPKPARAATISHHRRPICVYEEEDDEDDEDDDDDDDDEEEELVIVGGQRQRSRSRPAESRRVLSPDSSHPFRSRSQSQHVQSRRAFSPQSAHQLRSRSQSRHPESRRAFSPQSAHHLKSRTQSRATSPVSVNHLKSRTQSRATSPVSVHHLRSRTQSRAVSPVSTHHLKSRTQSRATSPVSVHHLRSRTQSRAVSPQSAHPYRSTPESRRSPRTSASDSEDDESDNTASSGDERALRPHGKALDAAPSTLRSLHERINRGQEVIHQEDAQRAASRYAPSQRDRRSPSRHSSHRRDYYEQPRNEYRQASINDDQSRSRSKRVPSKKYYDSEVYVSRPASSKKKSHTAGESYRASSQSVGSSNRRSTYLGNFFGSALQPPPAPTPGRLVPCIVCLDEERPISKTAKLKCGHRMCHPCLKRHFKLSISDPQTMPPKCCTADHIPLKHVEGLFDSDFKMLWNKKFAEYSSRNRIYCPCGEWIRPEDMRREHGHKFGKCGRCKTKICCACNGRWHYPRPCPRDEETNQFLEQAKREGWQRCHRCKHVVELKEGCNHMTCRCGAEFCMICGSKWKTCECPWFNFDSMESDPLDYATEHMPIPSAAPRSNPFVTGSRYDPGLPSPPSPREFRTESEHPAAGIVRPRPQSYEEEMLVRRLQESRDEKMARRMHSFGEYEGRGEDPDYGRDMDDHRPGNHPGQFAKDPYRRRPATVIVPSAPQPRMTHPPAVPPPPQSSFDPPTSGMEYGPSWARARLHHSPERFSERGPERWSDPPPQTRRHPSPERDRERNVDRERRRAPSVEKNRARSPDRRNTSLERRLVDRFNSGSRQGPPPLPMGSVMGSMGMMTPVRATAPPPPPHPHSYPLTHGHPHPHPYQHPQMHPHAHSVGHPIGASIPMAPVPPPAPPLSRMNPMMEEDFFPPTTNRSTRSLEKQKQVVSSGRRDQEPKGTGSPHAPSVKRRPPPKVHREHTQELPKDSVLAGLGGIGRGLNRVFEWRNYVEPGMPEGEMAAQSVAV
ncbi:hypothetical protein B0T19DRAFT_426205 [Cercophora scortea]|uniref:RBR-type E3 ubiquitin transferase n=1 Tax=Cercophora scortea TaxID=314031 RepID=A0AAE0IEA0_9PEZI|nr:hypothetical protein B0T19DRAFT_426205 [Cercophora scortea]